MPARPSPTARPRSGDGTTTPSTGWLAAAALALAGLVLLARASMWSDVAAVAAVPAVLAVCWRRPTLEAILAGRRWRTAAVAGAMLAAGAAAMIFGVQKPGQRWWVVAALVVAAVTVVAMLAWPSGTAGSTGGDGGSRGWGDGRRARGWLTWGAVLAGTAIGAVIVVSLSGQYPLDVWGLHRAAADRLAAGLTPWQGLGVVNASIFTPPGAVIDGYPYPLPTLLAYAGSDLLAGDPRWAGWVAWAATTGALAALARGRRDRAVLVVLLALTPGWFIVLRNSWTEPLSLALGLGGLLLWDRRPYASALLIGLMAVSKQFLGLALVVLVVAPVADRWRRSGVAAAAAGAAWLGGFALGPGQLEATIGFHLSQPARPDSANLYGALADLTELGWPGWLGPAAGLAAAVWLGRSVRGPRGFAWALAGALTVTFMLSSQAFPNYWWLVLGLVVGALTMGPDERAASGRDGRGPSSPATDPGERLGRLGRS